MNKDYIYNIISELAEADGLDVRDFVEQLYAERSYPSVEGLPEEIAQELNTSRRSKNDERYKKSTQEKMKAEIEHFKQLYPDVSGEAIPEQVWNAVTQGVPLCAAYALYEREQALSTDAARARNEKNSMAAPAAAGASVDSFITQKDIEAMTPSEVKKNYKQIIASMKKWK